MRGDATDVPANLTPLPRPAPQETEQSVLTALVAGHVLTLKETLDYAVRLATGEPGSDLLAHLVAAARELRAAERASRDIEVGND